MGDWLVSSSRPKAEAIIFVAALFVTGLILAFEASQPLTASQFMLSLGIIDWRVMALISPFAVASLISVVGVWLSLRAWVRGRHAAKWRWLAMAGLLGPFVAIAGRALVSPLMVPV